MPSVNYQKNKGFPSVQSPSHPDPTDWTKSQSRVGPVNITTMGDVQVYDVIVYLFFLSTYWFHYISPVSRS